MNIFGDKLKNIPRPKLEIIQRYYSNKYDKVEKMDVEGPNENDNLSGNTKPFIPT